MCSVYCWRQAVRACLRHLFGHTSPAGVSQGEKRCCKDVANMGPLAFRFDPEDGSEQKSEVLHEEDCLTQGGTE